MSNNSQASINIDQEKKILTVTVDLKNEDAKVLAYGALEIAKETCMQYFAIQQMNRQKQQQALGLLKPA